MADEQQVSTTPAATAAPVAVETPVSTPAPSSETVSAAPAAEAVTEAPVAENVLGDAAPAEPVKVETPAEVKAETKPEVKEGEKPVTETPVEGEAAKPAEAVLPTYEEFKIPEGVNLDKEQLGAFNKILGEIETGKLDHAGMQEAGQKLVDLATKATADSIQRLNDYYVQFHENQKKGWFESFKNDPEMGGANLDKTVSLLRDAVETYGGDEKQVAEFRSVMKETGVGNHPAVIRILNNMAQKIAKYTTEGDTGGAQRMVPGQRPAPSKVKDYQRFYSGGSN